ncbi:MAG: HD domain-containing phosphohydrolase [Pseudomonadota bacterium]
MTGNLAVADTTPLSSVQTVLCVDDETSILTSLKRALRKEAFQVLLANSGEEALEILREQPVDLVVSDMRMPNMDGAALLREVLLKWPDTMRILLTGYSDMESTISAINDAEIFRYVSKPWDNNDLIATIRQVLDHKKLRDEHAALTELTEKQNIELQELNQGLEEKVRARTAEIANAAKLLRQSYQQLQESYVHTISVFSHLMEFREGNASLHGEHVAKLSAEIARELALSEKECSDLHNAALLHDIGKLCFNEELTKTPYNAFSDEQRIEYQAHPMMGQMALLSISGLADTGLLIRSHHEHFDGNGFPDGLAGEAIPKGARIISIAADFDDLQNGIFLGKSLNASDAADHIKRQSGKRYDPELVDIFLKLVKKIPEQAQTQKELKISFEDMEPGMVVNKDIKADNGMLLLRKGQQLNEALIDRIHGYMQDSENARVIYIAPRGGE